MNRPTWESATDLWEVDGSLRDLYIKNTTIDDWRAFLEMAKSYRHEYTFDGQSQELSNAEELLENHGLLCIYLDTIKLHSHFFVPWEIELDIDPREVRNPEEHSEVLSFVEQLAQTLNKPALLTPESSDNVPFYSYDPSTLVWKKF